MMYANMKCMLNNQKVQEMNQIQTLKQQKQKMLSRAHK